MILYAISLILRKHCANTTLELAQNWNCYPILCGFNTKVQKQHFLFARFDVTDVKWYDGISCDCVINFRHQFACAFYVLYLASSFTRMVFSFPVRFPTIIILWSLQETQVAQRKQLAMPRDCVWELQWFMENRERLNRTWTTVATHRPR